MSVDPVSVDPARAAAATPLLVVTAHPGDFVWRAAGAIALTTGAGGRAVIACLTFGERGESARLWRQGYDLDQVKAVRRGEAEQASKVLGAEVEFFDVGDYPLEESPELLSRLVGLYRLLQPAVVLTHAPAGGGGQRDGARRPPDEVTGVRGHDEQRRGRLRRV